MGSTNPRNTATAIGRREPRALTSCRPSGLSIETLRSVLAATTTAVLVLAPWLVAAMPAISLRGPGRDAHSASWSTAPCLLAGWKRTHSSPSGPCSGCAIQGAPP